MDIWSVLEYTVMATVVGLLLWVIKWIFHDKLDARWHYFIWLVLLARLAVPAGFEYIRTPLSVFREIPVGKWIEKGRILAGRGGYEGVAEILGRVYLWGVLLLGACYLAAWLAVRLRAAFAPEADGDTREYVDGIGAKYGLKSCRHIRICRSGSPYICGLIDPVLVLPADNVKPAEPIIVHELLHRKYKDVGVNLLLRAVRAVNWFNPVIWYLTGQVQNDSEALCDQRVLERCGDCGARTYGELLIGMGEGKKGACIKTGTSNMAGAYRDMKTRIRRIRDFGKVPAGIGFVALCITLMLGVSAVGSAEVYWLEPLNLGFSKETWHLEKQERAQLERELLRGQCYHAHTPEEAVYLFLLAVRGHDPVYRMAVLPGEEREKFAEAAVHWLENKKASWMGDREALAAYFPKEEQVVAAHMVYNLYADGEQGGATVRISGRDPENFVEWKLGLVREDGWKVRLEEETLRGRTDYREEPLLYGSAGMGDFLVEYAVYNGGEFQELFMPDSDTAAEFPTEFSTEYKGQWVQFTYLGEEALSGCQVKVMMGVEPGAVGADDAEIFEYAAMSGVPAEPAEAYSFHSSDGRGTVVFDGGSLEKGKPVPISSGMGSVNHEDRWKPDGQACLYVRIYVDGAMVEEGEVWSGRP